MEKDLWGKNVIIHDPYLPGKYQRRKARMKYRRSELKEEQCRNCNHCWRVHKNKIYNKCEIIGSSDSQATDIALRNVCDLWEKELPKINIRPG